MTLALNLMSDRIVGDQLSEERDILLEFENSSFGSSSRVADFDPTVAIRMVSEISAREVDGVMNLETFELLFSALKASQEYWFSLLAAIKKQGVKPLLPVLRAYTNRKYWDITQSEDWGNL